jgi:hypothetical protein
VLPVLAVILAVLGSAGSAHAGGSSGMVISQVYGGGGNTGATYTHDFVELFNLGAASVSVAGWSVQYAPATGPLPTWQKVNLPNLVVPAGGRVLVQMAAGAGGVVALPTPDVTADIAMSATAGRVVLRSDQLACTGDCLAGRVDAVGHGIAVSFEGSGPAPAPSNTTAVVRRDLGCRDADDNAADFETAVPLPRNASTAAAPCALGPVPLKVVLDAQPDQAVEVTFTTTGTGLPASFVLEDDGDETDGRPRELTLSLSTGEQGELKTIQAAVPAGTAMSAAGCTGSTGPSLPPRYDRASFTPRFPDDIVCSFTLIPAPASPPPPPSGGSTTPVAPLVPALPSTPSAPAPRCRVPKLTGLTLARARVKLKAARCALGKVTRPRRARPGLVVRSQRPAAGRTGAAGLKVALTLGPKPKPKPRRGR